MVKPSTVYRLAAAISWGALTVLTIALCTPFVGTLLVLAFADSVGCIGPQQSDMQIIQDCSVLGINVSERASHYVGNAGLILTPAAFANAFGDLFLAWLAVSVLLSVAALRFRKRERQIS